MTSPQNATLGFPSTAILTITETLPTVTFSPNPVYVDQGESAPLTATVSPSSAAVVFASADPTIATVTPGPAPDLTVYGVGVGTTPILAMFNGAQIAFVNAVAQDDPKADITFTGNAFPNWPEGQFGSANGFAYGFTTKVTTNSAIKDWKIKQKIFALRKYRTPKNWEFRVTDGDGKYRLLTEAEYDKLKKDYDDSTWAAPKVTFGPDGPSFFNKALPAGAPIEQGEKFFRYYDMPGRPGNMNGFLLRGLPANLILQR